uniref:Uncharacterized protein n=1 Tax=Tolypothrix bouteillei VB521301 TaxID=1479485 RepID=A0A0C1RDN9_9CYAN
MKDPKIGKVECWRLEGFFVPTIVNILTGINTLGIFPKYYTCLQVIKVGKVWKLLVFVKEKRCF